AGARPLHATVAALEPGAARLAGGETVAADHVVVAAGAGSAALIGLPVTPVPGLMILTAPARARIAHVLTAPELMLRPADGGRILAGAEAGGSEIDRASGAIAAALLDQVRDMIAEPGLALARIVIGRRPMPADEHPLIGPVPGRPGVYAAVMHSGVTLAPGVAELVAGEVLDGTGAPLLAPFRPARLA
ncbi:MAG TPA: FAD-dependent oxidoreductase, partial [Thermohalobaculum sp.]|nr:FAD-dependent oxidoreductase [Thermohalobaculum sp.]